MKKTLDVDKFIADRNTMIAEGAERLKARTVGDHVFSLIERDGDLTLAKLMESLRQSPDRTMADPALTYLQQLVQNRQDE